MQKLIANKPVKLVTDKNEALMLADEATYLKNYKIYFSGNQNKGGDEGANLGVGTGLTSTVPVVPTLVLPTGKNKTIGGAYVVETNHLFVLNWNSNGLHGIYRINCNNQSAQVVIIDSRLNFSVDPKHALPEHRFDITIVHATDDNGNKYVKDQILKFIDGKEWQRWINVESAIATSGFDATSFPYFALKQPHFDFEELIDWAIRPPMIAPVITPIPRTSDDAGKENLLVDKSIQIAIVFQNSDGRTSVMGPHSTPYNYDRRGCSVNDTTTPRCLDVEFPAGSPLTEKILVLQRNCGGDWKLYDIINKFSSCGVNDPELIGDKYWLRQNPFADYAYDPVANTIKYKYCGDKECRAYSVADALRFQTDQPITSVAMANAGDGVFLINNKRDYDNLDCSVTDKIVPSVLLQENKAACAVKTVNIKVYAEIRRADQFYQFLYQHGESGTVKFGGLFKMYRGISPPLPVLEEKESDSFGLNLGGNKGMICYLAGTPYYAIGKQYHVDWNTKAKTEIGIINIDDSTQLNYAKDQIFNGQGYFVQEFEFNVPAGNYIARMARHNADLDSVYQKTSGYVMGRAAYNYNLSSRDINREKEIIVNACSGDFDGWTSSVEGLFSLFSPYVLMIASQDNEFSPLGRFIEGYLRESSETKIGIEHVIYDANHGGGNFNYNGGFTDHNGFFFSASSGGRARESQVDFFGKFNCQDFNRDNANFYTAIPGDDTGYYPNQDLYAKILLGNSYGPCNRVLVRGRVSDLNTQVGISGVGITIEGGGTFYTDAEGNYELVVHPNPSGARNGKIFYNSGGECSFVNEDCSCVAPEDYSDASVPCVSCNERVLPAINKSVRLTSYKEKTLKEGGRYPVGAIVADLAGRTTFINNVGYVDIPSILDIGKVIPAKIQWAINGNLNLAPEFKWFAFFVGNNLNYRRYLQWVGDKIEFLDINGEITATGNGAVVARVTIQSLLDYNINNNFNTNTAYQPTAGDRIRIYDDGKGKLLQPTETTSYMDYQILGSNYNVDTSSPDNAGTDDGKSFFIEYDNRLQQLKDSCGFWIEIRSPRDCAELEKYKMISGFMPVINGEISSFKDGVATPVKNGILDAYDSFLVNRSITIKTCSGNTQSHPFVSPSISDFWGANCPTGGKELTKDENASQKWYRMESIKSDEYVNEGRVNGLGTFRDTNIKRFKAMNFGGIVAAHTERGVIGYICEYDWFVTNFQQEFVKTTSEGYLLADVNDNVSNPLQKIGENYGCAYEDTATIDFYDGVCVFYDRKNSSVLLMNYSSIADISKIDNKSFFINKSKYIQNFNMGLAPDRYLLDLFEVCGKIDPHSNSYNLTFRPRNGLSDSVENFINNEREIFYDMPETICFGLDQKSWYLAAYTPEFYARVPQSSTGDELVSFVNGKAYYHNSKLAKDVDVFYGVKTDQVIEIVAMGEPSKDKTFQRIAIESAQAGYFIDSVKTSVKGIFSYVPSAYFGKLSAVCYSKLLMNTNVYPDPEHPVGSTLIDGGSLFGGWAKIRLVKNITEKENYSELNDIFVTYVDKEKSKK